MAYTAASLPLTGAGDATANVGVDRIAGTDYQMVKMMDGSEGSTIVFLARETTPGSTDAGLVVRPIGSTAHLQGIAGTVTVGNPTTAVTISNPTTSVSLSSQHTVTVGNPTTAVTVSSGAVLGAGSSANMLGAVAQGAGSTSVAPWYVISSAGGAGSTAVDLSSGGSTRSVGTVNQGSAAGTSADAWWARMVTTATIAGSTRVDADLSSAGSTKTVGVVSQGSPAGTSADAWWVRTVTTGSAGGSTHVDADLSSAGSTKVVGTVNVSSGVILGAGSTANAIGSVALLAGSSANLIGANIISSGSWSSANILGQVAQGPGSSASSWIWGPVPFSSGNVARSSVATSVDVQIVAADSTRKAMTIGNRSTAQTVGIGFSTAAVTTALANVDIFLPPSGSITFGMPGGLPLYRGPLRAINLTSTAVAGSVGVVQFG